jgi:hypothetical protein
MTNIELPRDAAGREIPLDTTVLYDKNDKEVVVSRYQYYPRVGYGYWNIKSVRNEYYRVDEVYLTPPDTIEKLLDDLDNAAKGGDNAECCYMRRDGIEVGTQCPGCRLYEQGKDKFNECSYLAYADIAARIRKLAAKESE